MTGYQVQVRGEWGGTVDGWRPAVTGTLNQTGRDDAWASTEDTHEEARALLDAICLLTVGRLDSGPCDGDPRDNAPHFRIVEVDS